MKSFICKECGTRYSTPGKNTPPTPDWDDGHVCELSEVNSKINREEGVFNG